MRLWRWKVQSWNRSWVGLLVAAGLVVAAPSARAGTLRFTGSLTILLAGYGAGITGGGTATVNGSGGLGRLDSLGIPAGTFGTQTLVVPITTPIAFPVAGLQLTAANGEGAFDKPGGGAMPILGSAKVCLFGPCSEAVANLEVPLDVVGVGGTTYVSGLVNVTVQGAPWTTATAAIGTSTVMGHSRGPASQTSSTARSSGIVQLVTPIFIRTNLAADLSAIPAFAILNLHFVPEPTTLVLLGAGLGSRAASRRERSPPFGDGAFWSGAASQMPIAAPSRHCRWWLR